MVEPRNKITGDLDGRGDDEGDERGVTSHPGKARGKMEMPRMRRDAHDERWNKNAKPARGAQADAKTDAEQGIHCNRKYNTTVATEVSIFYGGLGSWLSLCWGGWPARPRFLLGGGGSAPPKFGA